jgi:hypothetical protein
VKRLLVFATLRIRKSKGQSTNATIGKRLAAALRTGECVDVTLKDERSRDCRVIAIDAGGGGGHLENAG